MDQLVLCGTDPAAWTVLQFPRAAKTREHNSALKSTTRPGGYFYCATM